MTFNFAPLKDELKIWRQDNHKLPLWWRDDDAIEDTPDLRKLLNLSRDVQLPVHLAIIPQPTQPSLVECCAEADTVVPIIHGWSHQNHAPKDQKKAEFGHPRAEALAETNAAMDRLQQLFGARLLKMFVPPWNRIDPSITDGLAAQGYKMLSTYRPRPARMVAGLEQINTHVDPIFWRGGGGLVDPDEIIAGLVKTLQERRAGATDDSEPLGFLTHHLVHDAAIWDFTKHCLATLLDGGALPCDLSKTGDIS